MPTKVAFLQLCSISNHFSMKHIYLLFLLIVSSLAVTSCRARTNPNEWLITTDDCWNSVDSLKAGSVVPRLFTACDRAIILPATALSAELHCETKFRPGTQDTSRIAASLEIAYNWQIIAPTFFIRTAKSITSAGVDEDHKVLPEELEAIENSVVDKAVQDIVREYTPRVVVGTSELILEQELSSLLAPIFAARGVLITGMSINVTFSTQVEEALDVMAAYQIYKAQGMEELGKIVIANKAGAANIQSSPEAVN